MNKISVTLSMVVALSRHQAEDVHEAQVDSLSPFILPLACFVLDGVQHLFRSHRSTLQTTI
jgi:hypothetical protein